MSRCGLNVDYVATDWGTMLQRRNKKEPIDQGGWNAFITGWAGADHINPAGHIALRGNGDSPGAWPGWCVSAKLEEQRRACSTLRTWPPNSASVRTCSARQ